MTTKPTHISQFRGISGKGIKYDWYVYADVDGVSDGEFRHVGDIVSRHTSYDAAAKKARKSTMWAVAHIGDLMI